MVNASITADGTGLAAGKVCREKEEKRDRKEGGKNRETILKEKQFSH